MARIWAKIMIKDKIVGDAIIDTEKYFGYDEFVSYIQTLCYELDIPNPIVLSNHFEKFMEFNNVKFIKDDFVEEVHFERLVLEKA